MSDNNKDADLTIPGIDGGTPLGFLAALGLLQVLDDAHLQGGPPPRLSWKQLDAWRPVLHGAESFEGLAQAIHEDCKRWSESPLLSFRYVKQEKQGPKAVGGLKAPLAVVRAWSNARRSAEDEESLAYAAALFCDGVTEVNKKPATAADHVSLGIPVDPDVAMALTVERSFFDLTARNAQFLEQVELIRAHLTPGGIEQALRLGAVDYAAPRTLDWDPASDTPGAIYTGYQRGFLPVHEWLGFRALRVFPLSNAGSRPVMTGCTGRRLDGDFTWPLWDRPASLDAVRSLIAYPRLTRLKAEERRALGISTLLQAGLTKKADGYTGTFSPARPV
ncbi:MAG: hypothetical protein B6A08_10345 [Sorangiineae bacterium NIC37A_2]|nr:MAG: hypothetical protein B6A08_10345 [Sorangiineae bacterium NIC37A_2]